MKKYSFQLFIAVLLISNFSFAQPTTILNFGKNYGKSGSAPFGSLVENGNYLYGTTTQGGIYDKGVIFRINMDGSGYTNIFEFNGTTSGKYPESKLVFDGVYFYGVASGGGTYNMGTLFKIKPDGSNFSTIINFDGTALGKVPTSSLYYDGTYLFGTTLNGGTYGYGTIYKIKPDGSEYSKLLDFAAVANGNGPWGTLTSDGTFLYGSAIDGGTHNGGTIFKIQKDGTNFLKILDLYPNKETAPRGGIIYDGTYLYSVFVKGQTSDTCGIYKYKTDGTDFTLVHYFDGGIDGGNVVGDLSYDDTYLYGMTGSGGINDSGTVFRVKPDGTMFTKLLDLDGFSNGSQPISNSLIIGNKFYGMTTKGGTENEGTVFSMNIDGTNYQKFFDFDGVVNAMSNRSTGGLVYDGTYLYGMTPLGGKTNANSNNYGVIYKVKPDGTGYSSLHKFLGGGFNDGANPYGSLVLEGEYLYGMTQNGCSGGKGCIFKIKPKGTNYKIIFSFSSLGTTTGSSPYGSLISDGTFLYGMTYGGGDNGNGAVFKIKLDGSEFAKIHDFDGINGNGPCGSLLYDGTFLYGMTWFGGTESSGVIFKIKPDGSEFSKLLDFTGANGRYPNGSLITDGTFLFGMTKTGGTRDFGTTFKISKDGLNYSKLMDFSGSFSPYGSNPLGDLFLKGTDLYGMSYNGGVFKIKTDGTGYNYFFEFNGPNGNNPTGTLISIGSQLYGTTGYGGTNDLGTIFKFCPRSKFNQTLTICAGDSLSIGKHKYFSAGTYIDTLIAVSSCDSIVTTILNVRPEIVSSQNVTICSNQSVTVGKNTYNKSGIYKDVFISQISGCDSTITTNLTVNDIESTVISSSGSLVAQLGSASYQWIDCNNSNLPINGQTNMVFTPSGSGKYALIVNKNTCVDTSACFDYVLLSADDAFYSNNSTMEVYPNPSKGDFKIIGNEGVYFITNELGLTVYSCEIKNNNEVSIDLPSGIYFINSNNYNHKIKIVVIK